MTYEDDAALGASIGRFTGASIMGVSDILGALVVTGTLKPRHGRAILLRMAENTGEKSLADNLAHRARSFMAYSPRPKKGKRRL